jgi:hypothetical protein
VTDDSVVTEHSITAFLLARIAEDEAIAQAALEPWAGEDDGATIGDFSRESFVFVKHFGPDRVLADCEAKSRIINLHNPCADWSYGDATTCPELVALASVYADHPDYRDKWRA